MRSSMLAVAARARADPGVPDAVDAKAVDDIVEYAQGEGVGALEDHADLLPEVEEVGAGPVDVLSVDEDLPRDPDVLDKVRHPVERPEEGRLAAAGRPDEGGDPALLDVQADALEGLELPVVEVEIADFDDGHEVTRTSRGDSRPCAYRPGR